MHTATHDRSDRFGQMHHRKGTENQSSLGKIATTQKRIKDHQTEQTTENSENASKQKRITKKTSEREKSEKSGNKIYLTELRYNALRLTDYTGIYFLCNIITYSVFSVCECSMSI